LKLLHDYNFESLQTLGTEVFQISKLLKMLDFYVNERSFDKDAALIVLEDLASKADQCSCDFEIRLISIMSQSVPPEGEEEIPQLVYPERDCKVG